MIMSREQIVERLKTYLQELFEVPAEKIRPDARLYEDLDLDSIDAVDLVVKLQELTGRKMKVEEFKSVRTVDDVVNCIHAVLAE